jgi:hypothetical protein
MTSTAVRRLTTAARIVLGLPLFVNGLNGFLHFLPEPAPSLPPGAMAFVGALVSSGYMLPLIAGTHLLAGSLLLANRFVPLALALLAPFLVNSLVFHGFLEPSGLPVALAFTAIEVCLAIRYRKAFQPMLAARAIV